MARTVYLTRSREILETCQCVAFYFFSSQRVPLNPTASWARLRIFTHSVCYLEGPLPTLAPSPSLCSSVPSTGRPSLTPPPAFPTSLIFLLSEHLPNMRASIWLYFILYGFILGRCSVPELYFQLYPSPAIWREVLMILLPQLPECWDDWCAPPRPSLQAPDALFGVA